jgi:hypothetical protein
VSGRSRGVGGALAAPPTTVFATPEDRHTHQPHNPTAGSLTSPGGRPGHDVGAPLRAAVVISPRGLEPQHASAYPMARRVAGEILHLMGAC